MSDEVLKQIADTMAQQTALLSAMQEKELHTKAPANYNTATMLHGNAGIFGVPGIDRDVITAHVRPYGLASALPMIPTRYESPRYATLTGYTDVVGSEPTYPCEDAPAGYVKGCNLTAQFGRVARQTQTIEIDKVILQRNRGDMTDLVLRGAVLDPTSPFHPADLSDMDILNLVVKSEMVGVGVQMERRLNTMMWQGTPTSNTAGGGYKEFPGLDLQIATGQKDADTNVTCPALDSDVKDFNYSLVDGSDKDIVEYMSMVEFYIRNNAMRMGLMPASWVWVMRPELWFELSAVWPCRYNTNKCNVIDTAGIDTVPMYDAADGTRTRDAMRNGMYIDVNGNRYPVVVDDGIYEHNNINNAHLAAGEYASSIYMVPMTITGNFRVAYMEYLDYRAAMPEIALLRGKEMFWTDDGRFMWAMDDNKFCFTLTAKTEPRVILRTPQLAGKIQNVKYTPLQHLRSSDPDSEYFKDGGVSLRSASTLYAAWRQ